MEDREYCEENGVLLQRNVSAQSSVGRHKERQLIAWIVFFSGISCYCFAYLLRVYPSVMECELSSYFGITAGGFGLLTSFYYFAYAPMQLPVGVIVDRVGARRSLIIASMISTLGTFVFAYFKLFDIALIGRFMVGFGAAFCLRHRIEIGCNLAAQKIFRDSDWGCYGFWNGSCHFYRYFFNSQYKYIRISIRNVFPSFYWNNIDFIDIFDHSG